MNYRRGAKTVEKWGFSEMEIPYFLLQMANKWITMDYTKENKDMEKYYKSNVVQLKTRKNKPWQAVVLYRDMENNRLKKTKMLPKAKGKKDAQRLAEEWRRELNELETLSPTFDKEKTIAEVVLDYIEYQHRSGEIENSTYNNRKHAYNSLGAPYLGDYSFLSLDRNIINGWLAKLNNRGLAQGTIGIGFYTVRKVYDYYYEIGELTRNPFQGVKPPKKGEARKTHLTKEQMENFLNCLENEPPKFKLACYLAFYAGLRRGEICGLRWRDIDFKLGVISINSAIGIGEVSYAKQPKNKSSIRTFPIVPQLLEELKKNVDEPNYFVIGDKTSFMAPSTLSFEFKQFVKAHDIVDAYGKPITLHCLRHNLGTVGINSGMDIASLSRMMGHSSRAMTLDTYGDSDSDAMKVATEKLGAHFGK